MRKLTEKEASLLLGLARLNKTYVLKTSGGIVDVTIKKVGPAPKRSGES